MRVGQVLLGALRTALLRPSDVGRLEMHGTGTPLGDPIEVGAALAVLRGGAHPVALTAAKSRAGHAEPAAGAVSLLQVPLHLIRLTGQAADRSERKAAAQFTRICLAAAWHCGSAACPVSRVRFLSERKATCVSGHGLLNSLLMKCSTQRIIILVIRI